MSIKETGFVRFSSFLTARYSSNACCNTGLSVLMLSISVKNVVCLQWSDQYVSIILISVIVGFLPVSLK